MLGRITDVSSTAISTTSFTLDCGDQSVTVANALFDSNTAASGGALGMPSHHKNALFKVSASTFAHNTATHGRGGAAFASGPNSGFLFSEGCSFLDNSAARDGGAVSVMDSAGMQATDVVAKRNRAAHDGGFLHASFASPMALSCVVRHDDPMASQLSLKGLARMLGENEVMVCAACVR